VHRLGPADRVTLVRAALGWLVAALVADSLAGHPHRVLTVAVAVVALLLDRIDGEVARRTGTASEFGARFDMEADAFLVLVLSIGVTPLLGGWVLLAGAARYLLWLAARWWPWLSAEMTPRPWNKVVAALQGITLTAALAAILPPSVSTVLVGVALALLAESFAHQVHWIRRHRRTSVDGPSRMAQAART
jgi:phosphatidylglycerophosphate synthase